MDFRTISGMYFLFTIKKEHFDIMSLNIDRFNINRYVNVKSNIKISIERYYITTCKGLYV